MASDPQPPQPPDDEPATGFPEPPGADPGDRSRDPSPHHVLNNPVGEPDPTEWPDPYEQRPDPRDPTAGGSEQTGGSHTTTGATSTSEPHPRQDPDAEAWAERIERDKLDD